MELDLDSNQAKYQIRAYQPGTLLVNDTTYSRSIVISPDTLIDDWKPQHISELTSDDLAVISELSPAILLIGTGSTLAFPKLDIYGDLINEGIGVEVMDTGAACRTFNALTAENRNVAAALIIK
ncbi:MAG TPA: Mth938-like domain-containing protein [Gammaproteobacteria bacterium]|nr:Mth938-like domain-containing protein [Gammaproteobacteria bacterium]